MHVRTGLQIDPPESFSGGQAREFQAWAERPFACAEHALATAGDGATALFLATDDTRTRALARERFGARRRLLVTDVVPAHMGYHDASDAAAVAAAYASSLVDWYLLGSCGYIVKGINTGFPRTAGVFALGAVWLWSNEVQALQMHGGLPGGAPCRAVHGAAREMWKHLPAGW